MWILGDKPIDSLGARIEGLVPRGVKFRVLFPEKLLPLYGPKPGEEGIVERRMIPSVPATILCTEGLAGVSLLSVDGRPDYALFYGDDPSFLKWANDLFLYYWNSGKPCTPA